MPNYEYECEKCKHYFEFFTTIEKMLQPESEACPECSELCVKKVMFTAPAMGDSVRLGIRRPDGGFKEVLQKIHQNVPGSNLNTDSRYI
jgi:putative FmdB family regulatory protein